MVSVLKNALAASLFAALCLALWRLAYAYTDWAVLALIPLGVAIFLGLWPLVLAPWQARLRVALREDSPLGRLLTGRIKACVAASVFSGVAVAVLAWQAWTASLAGAAILAGLFFLSAVAFAWAEKRLLTHLHRPFAPSAAAVAVTWALALPFTGLIAWFNWSALAIPGAMLQASFQEALVIGQSHLPPRGGPVAALLAIPCAYDGAKMWLVVQLRDYPLVGVLWCLEAALCAFVLARSAIALMQFVQTHTHPQSHPRQAQ